VAAITPSVLSSAANLFLPPASTLLSSLAQARNAEPLPGDAVQMGPGPKSLEITVLLQGFPGRSERGYLGWSAC